MNRTLFLLPLFGAVMSYGQVWESVGGGFEPGNVGGLYMDDQDGRLYAVGDMRRTILDGTIVNGVAYWDGVDWYPLADGIDVPGIGVVPPAFAVTRYDDAIVVAGGFPNLDSVTFTERIGEWRNNAWGSLGVDETMDASFRGLSEIDGELHAYGLVDTVDGIFVGGWAIWDGAAWRRGDTLEIFEPGVTSVVKYQGQYHVGGNIDLSNGRNDLVRLGTNGWEELGPGIVGDPMVEDMVVYDGLLWVTGYFSAGNGNAASSLMAWDGYQWMNPFPQIEYYAQGRDLHVANGKLYAAGLLHVNGMAGNYGLLEYDGSSMCVIGGQDIALYDLACTADTIYAATCWTLSCDQFGPELGRIAKWPLDAPPDTCFAWHVGVEELDYAAPEGFTLFPNPSNGLLTATCTGDLCDDVRALSLYDACGREVVRAPLLLGTPVSLTAYAPGAYVVRLQDGDGKVLHRGAVILQP